MVDVAINWLYFLFLHLCMVLMSYYSTKVELLKTKKCIFPKPTLYSTQKCNSSCARYVP